MSRGLYARELVPGDRTECVLHRALAERVPNGRYVRCHHIPGTPWAVMESVSAMDDTVSVMAITHDDARVETELVYLAERLHGRMESTGVGARVSRWRALARRARRLSIDVEEAERALWEAVRVFEQQVEAELARQAGA